jgi:hypothetical protein
MINLAGKQSNCQITKELNQAGIPIVAHEEMLNTEPITNLTGQLGNFTFTRAWYYWVVSGELPLQLAEELYNNEIGKKDVRVAGHCGCPPPKEWMEPSKEDQEEIKRDLGYRKDMDVKDMMKFWKNNEVKYKEECKKYYQYIHCYHIDSQEGLNLFVETLKKYNLDKDGE